MARNWAGTYEYAAACIVVAASERDVVEAVTAAPGRIHALGTRHSFTDLPDTSDTLIDVSGLEGGFVLDEEAATVTLAAGTRYGVLALWLEERGWALANMGSLPHISVAGASATGTHGSGDGNQVLSTSVRALRYVAADGDVRDIRRGDPDFDAVVVGLGAFGIVVAVTLDIQPTYLVRQDIYTGMTWDTLLSDVAAVTGAGYSVSVFTRWVDDGLGDVWIKRRVDDRAHRREEADVVPDEFLGAVRRTGAEEAFESLLGDNRTVVGEVGPWMLRLPHFRLDAEPSFGEEIQTEYFVPRHRAAEALAAVRPLGRRLQPHLVVTELRTAAADGLWLSPAYERDVFVIHFTWLNHPDEVRALLPDIERALAPFGARPHWGKLHAFDRSDLERVHPRLAAAREVFERLDPEGRFVNDHLVRVGVRDPR